MTLFDILAQHANTRPNDLAFKFIREDGSESQCSFMELFNRSKAIAASLQARALPGDRVILMYRPGLDFIEAILACFASGLVAVPIQTIQNKRSIQRLYSTIADAQSKLILTDNVSIEKIRRLCPDLMTIASEVSWLETAQIKTHWSVQYQDFYPESDELALLQYTAGSEGPPKGVMISHDNIMNNQAIIQEAFQHDHSTHVVGWLPLHQDMGLNGNIFQPLYLGVPATLFAPITCLLSPLTWLKAVSAQPNTTSGAPSFAYDLCAKRVSEEEKQELDLSNWRNAFISAEPVRADIIDDFAQCFVDCGFRKDSFYPCYGLAESTLFVAGGKPSSSVVELSVDQEALQKNRAVITWQGMYRLVGCGKSHGDHDLIIVSPRERRQMNAGQVGEIWISGPSIAQGYWGREEETQQTFNAYTEHGHGPYLKTGDVGFIRDGELFITGRISDRIVVDGLSHFPTDLEFTLSKNDEDWLREGYIATFMVRQKGLPKLVAVAEVQRSQVRKFKQARLKEITNRARKAIANRHGLQLADFVLIRPATMPKTTGGKIQRQLCRQKYLRGELVLMAEEATA